MPKMNMSSYVRSTPRPRQASRSGRPNPTNSARGVSLDRCDVDVVHLGAVQASRRQMPGTDQVARVGELLSLLSNPTRLRILLALRSVTGAPERELCVCDLAVVAEASKSLTSHQLRLLRAAGLVVPRRRGKLVYYRLAGGAASGLITDVASLTEPPDTERPGAVAGSKEPVRAVRSRRPR